MHRRSIALAALAGFVITASGLVHAAPSQDIAETVDTAPCFAAISAGDDDRIIADCATLIGHDRTARPDRLRALLARAGAFTRKDQIDRAIADNDAVLRLAPGLPDVFNARGELFRRQGNRPRALADFGAALKLDRQHAAARANYKSLALELEKLGADMAIKYGAIKNSTKPPLK